MDEKSIIYVIDDDIASNSVISDWIEKFFPNCIVKSFCSFEDANKDDYIELVDVFIIDVMLKTLPYNGMELCRKIHENRNKSASYLFISGYEDGRDMVDKVLDNSDCLFDFISKPFLLEPFINRLKLLIKTSHLTRQNENKYNLSEGKFKYLYEASDEGIIIHHNNKIVHANISFCNLFKIDCDKIFKGRYKVTDFITKSDHVVFFDKLKNNEKSIYKINALKNDNTEFLAEFSTGYMLNNIEKCDEENVLVTTIRDLSEVKKAKETISFIWSIFNYSKFFVLVLSNDFKVKLCNWYLASRLGYDDETKIIGSDWRRFVPQNYIPILGNLRDIILKNSDNNYQEFVNDIITLDNKVITVRWFNGMIQTNGKGIFSIGVPIEQTNAILDSEESIRSYWKNMILKDGQALDIMKEVIKGQPKQNPNSFLDI